MKLFGYSKEQKLKQKKDLDLLFEKGKWKTAGPLRLILKKTVAGEKGKFGVSVSKRLYKRAVDRNRIKRLLREAYRLNREVFEQKYSPSYLAMLFWVSKVEPKGYAEVEAYFLELCKQSDGKTKI